MIMEWVPNMEWPYFSLLKWRRQSAIDGDERV